MSRKEFVFSMPIVGTEDVTVFAETIEEAIEKMKNGEDSSSYLSEVSWTEEPTLDHLVAERGEG